jgi:hypothetical protein
MYLQKSFTVPVAPEKITACEACVYGRGPHAEWCRSQVLGHRDSALTAQRRSAGRAVNGIPTAPEQSHRQAASWYRFHLTDDTGYCSICCRTYPDERRD